jgi:hypothetical protein
MGRVFAAIGMIVVALIAIGIVGFGYLAHKGRALDEEAAAYSGDAVTAITAHWDAAALTARAAPHMAQAVTPGKLTALFAWFATLGPMQDTPTCRGTSSVYANVGGTSTITANYTCDARYQAGEAAVSVGLVKLNGAWRISGFHVTSPALIPQKPGQPI